MDITKITTFDYNGYTGIKGISKDDLDLDKTLNCGQCFRWNKLPDGSWFGIINNNLYMIKEKIFADGQFGFITTASVDEVYSILVDYFQLEVDYLDKIDFGRLDEYTLKYLEYGKGIRILKQDKWEMLITFIISQRNSIKRIGNTVEKLSEAFGTEISFEVNGKIYSKYTFPTANQLKNKDLSKDFGLGYRDKYIVSAVNRIYNDIDLLRRIEKLPSEKCVWMLTTLPGIGDKVANCVALFGMGKLDCFPVDTWIQKGLQEQSANGIRMKFENFKEVAGYVQQCMFYTERYIGK